MMIDGKCGVSVENGDSMIQAKSIRLYSPAE
jgi:hypothetical protein